MIRGELAQRAQRLIDERQPFAVATVVRAQRPTSARVGDSALVGADGAIEGFVGGVCAESSVRVHALRVLETGEALVLRIEPDAPQGEDGSATSVGTVTVHNPCLSGGALEILLEPVLPAPRMVVLGDTPIARALVRLAAAAGFDAVSGGAEEVRPQPSDAALIAASHGRDEERVLADALATGVPYVGLVASAKRGAAVRDSLDVPAALRAQLHTPAGLDIGARTPEEIAIAILAQVVAERRVAHHVHEAAPAATATTAIDPVCGMEVVVSDAAPSLEVGGERFYFCCERCRDAYAEQHLPDAARQ